jgi:TRAP transporter TAXI family solute receptor
MMDLSRRGRMALAASVAVLLVLLGLALGWTLSAGPGHTIVLATDSGAGLYHVYAHRYKAILAAQGIQVEERRSSGSAENLRPLLDPASGVDAGFVQGGVATAAGVAQTDRVVMLASLYYSPLWVFKRSGAPSEPLRAYRGRSLAVGPEGSATNALTRMLLAANGIEPANTPLLPLDDDAALEALRKGEVEVAFIVGGPQAPAIAAALRDPALELVSLPRADAYPRRASFVSRLSLPAGTIDPAADIPPAPVETIGTKVMLAARADLHPTLVNALLDAAQEIHKEQGLFEAPGQFPDTLPLDLPVSRGADQHMRFGPVYLYQVLPLWAASLVERLALVVVPLLALLIPALNYYPRFVQWRARSAIHRTYGELALLEREIGEAEGTPPLARWLAELDRLFRTADRIRVPPAYEADRHTLLGHVQFVRALALEKANAADARAAR